MTVVLAVVPTRNAARTIEPCLRSLRAQTHPVITVVVDNHSTDDTRRMAGALADEVIVAGPERSRQRNVGARSRPSDVLLFIDADMHLAGEVVAQAVDRIEGGAGAVIVPERTVGAGRWARVRAYERSLYECNDDVEAARAYDTALFEHLGGFDEALTGPEDWDLSMRARSRARVDRIDAWIDHDEHEVSYLTACRKKAYYAPGLSTFVRGRGASGLAPLANRAWLRHPITTVARDPLLGTGLYALKVGETVAVAGRLAKDLVRAHSPRAPGPS